MASLIEELMDTLEKEIKEYRDLLEMAQQKTACIIKGDIKELMKITEAEQLITDRIAPLDRKRENCTKDIAIVINRKAEELTITKLITLMENQPKVKKRLEQIHDDLQNTLKQLAKVNNMNKGLLEEALDLVNFDISLINSLRQAPLTADYDKTATNTDAHLMTRGRFDKTQ